MKIIVDDKIPFIREAIKQITDEAVYLPGSAIGPDDVKDADAMIIRTRTRCDRHLLEHSRVQFIATATIGYDHIDTAYLKEKGIAWANCPGCNANSVAQYIYSCLLLLEKEKHYDLHHTSIGLIGVGHVGTAVQRAITPLGVRTLLYDPPREEAESGLPPAQREHFATIEQIQSECDIISFHTPLITEGAHPTLHFGNRTFLHNLSRCPIIINTSRGAVIDNTALLEALDNGCIKDAIVDTWENEPHINTELLKKVYIGTPHIAGYSADGKANATRMALEALCHFFKQPATFSITPPELPENLKLSNNAKEKALQLYNPKNDSFKLKNAPECFEQLRGNYPLRREFYEKKL